MRPSKRQQKARYKAFSASGINARRIARIAALDALALQKTGDPGKDESNSNGQPKTCSRSRQGTFAYGSEKPAKMARIENEKTYNRSFKPGIPICLICRDGCTDKPVTPARLEGVEGFLNNDGIQSQPQEFNLTDETIMFLFKRLISLPADKIKEFENLKIDEKPVWNYVGFCPTCQRILENSIVTTKKIGELKVEISKLQGRLQQSMIKMENLAKSSKSLVDVVPLAGNRQERKRLWNLMKEIRLKIITSSYPPSENIIDKILPTVPNPNTASVSKFQNQKVTNKILKKSRETLSSKTIPQPQQYSTIESEINQDFQDLDNNSTENFEDSFPMADFDYWDEEFLEYDSEGKKAATVQKSISNIEVDLPIYKISKSQLIQRRAADYLAVDPLAPSEIFLQHERYINAGVVGECEYLNAQINPTSEVRLSSITPKTARNENPCGICKEVFDIPMEASQHRRFIHPGLALCTGPAGTLQCRKIFHSHEIKQHRLEAHPLFKCSECVEAFSSSELRSMHMQKEHNKPCSFELNLNNTEESLTVKPLSLETIEAHAAPRVVLKRCFNLNLKDFDKLPDGEFVWFSWDEENNVKLLGLVEKSKPTPSEPQDCDFEDMLIKEELDSDDEECEEISVDPEQNLEMEASDQFAPTLSPIPENEEIADEEKSSKPETQQAKKPYSLVFEFTQPPPRKKLYKCGICNSIFKDQADLLKHFSENHNVSSKFGCYVCRQAFDSVALCEAHIASDHPVPATVSNSRKNTIPNKPSLSSVFHSTATVPIPRKSAITKRTKTPALLTLMSSVFGRRETHIATDHPPANSRKNTIPNTSSPFVFGHVGRDHNWCFNCRIDFNTSDALAEHKKNCQLKSGTESKLLSCPMVGCDRKGFTETGLKAHLLSAHNMIEREGNPYRLIRCSEPGCKARYTSELQFLRHKWRSHNIKSERKCTHCPLKFPYDPPHHAEYKLHFEKAHTHRIAAKCPVCGKEMEKSRIKSHIQLKHENIPRPRPHICEICGKSFTAPSFLKYHAAIHSEDRPFLCHLCGKDFKTKNNLYIHGWSHDPDKKTKWSAYKPKPNKPGQKKRVRKNPQISQKRRVRVGKPASNVD